MNFRHALLVACFCGSTISPEEAKEKWHNTPLMAPVNEGRNKIKYWTPLEALEQAISRIGLLRRIKSWPNPNMARSNLDALRGTCKKYIDQCNSHRSAATVDGFVTYLRTASTEQALGFGDMTVNVLTYHSAKGLEWPWVVLTDLDASPRAAVFGVNVEAATQFDMTNPLANRKIRYWPWPFGAQKAYSQFDEKVSLLPLNQIALDKAEYEEQRLLYVGMTRAKDGLVMAIRKTEKKQGFCLKTGWLDSLKDASGESVIKWDSQADSQMIQVGSAQISIKLFEYRSEMTDRPRLMIEEKEYLPSLPPISVSYPVSRISPSSLSASQGDMEEGTWEIIQRFDVRINIHGKPEMDALGSAVHAYLAVDHSYQTNEERIKLAQSILQLWGVEMSLDPSDVVASGQRLDEYLKQHYPGHKAFREWPMSLRNEKGQLLQGWIDLLLETPDGFVIIDHKDYPGQNAVERVKKYIPQLKAYKRAVEMATGKPVIDTLLHLPISGLILRFYRW